MTKAILIDPYLPSITPVKVVDYKCIQRHIGCDVFTCVRFPDGEHVAYVDDEGLINGTEKGIRFVDKIYPSITRRSSADLGIKRNGRRC